MSSVKSNQTQPNTSCNAYHKRHEQHQVDSGEEDDGEPDRSPQYNVEVLDLEHGLVGCNLKKIEKDAMLVNVMPMERVTREDH
jgi:hypothetical protein